MVNDNRIRGIDHMAFPTFDPVGTIRFYRDVLGCPLVETMQVKGWGPEYQTDFVHFFFDIGNEDRLAFFYYFGQPEYRDDRLPPLLDLGRHVALHVDTLEDLAEYERRLKQGGVEIEMKVMHETVESVYVRDPNHLLIEIARPLRELTETDAVDAEITVQALLDVLGDEDGPGAHGEPSLAALWARKAQLIDARFAPAGDPAAGAALTPAATTTAASGPAATTTEAL
ncbi:MAG TPA: VOC family protein [Actinocrinis sp.]|nr:VOC family protein [Actinocrinis sp.]